MSQLAAVASASLARSSPRCQPWSSRPRLPSGSSRLWSGPATNPSSEIDMWQVVSGIGVLPRWLRFASGDSTLVQAIAKSPDLLSRRHEAALVREDDGLHAVAQAGLGKDPRYMRLDGPVTEEELLCNLSSSPRRTVPSCGRWLNAWSRVQLGRLAVEQGRLEESQALLAEAL